MKDIFFFCLGWFVRMTITSVLLELAVRPLAHIFVKRMERYNPVVVEHYLQKHTGKSYACVSCNPSIQLEEA